MKTVWSKFKNIIIKKIKKYYKNINEIIFKIMYKKKITKILKKYLVKIKKFN